MKFNETLVDIVKTDLEVGNIPALMGEPGIGKSSFMEDVAYAMGTKCFTLQCNLLADKADLTGGRLMKDDNNGEYRMSFFPHEDIMEAIEYAETNPREWPILFLDEINRTTSDVTSAALGLSTARKIGRKHLPKNLRLTIAGNLKGNVTALDEASLSRFSIYNVEPDGHALVSILGDELNPWVKKVLSKSPNLVFQKSTPTGIAVDGTDDDDDDANVASVAELFDASEEMNQLTTPRTIDYLSRWLNKVDRDKLSAYLATPATIGDRDVSALNEIIEAKVGNTGFATQLVATIADDLTSGPAQNSANQIVVPKPNCYASLKAASTITELEDLISDLTESEKSGSLVFAFKENEDNTRLIEQLAEATQKFERDHMQTLVEMMRNQQVDTTNVEAFLNTDTDMANSVKPVLSSFL